MPFVVDYVVFHVEYECDKCSHKGRKEREGEYSIKSRGYLSSGIYCDNCFHCIENEKETLT